jgi:hypothetical protein
MKAKGGKEKMSRKGMMMREARWPVQIVGLQGDFKTCT